MSQIGKYTGIHKCNKARIWLGFKDFYRRLCLKFHFHKDNGNVLHTSDEEKEILESIGSNLEEANHSYQNIHKKFKEKSIWKPTMTHQVF